MANVISFQEAAVARAYRQIGRSAEAGSEIEELVFHVIDMRSAVKKELLYLILFFDLTVQHARLLVNETSDSANKRPWRLKSWELSSYFTSLDSR